MANKIKIRNKTIAEQFASMKNRYPQFVTTFTSHDSISVIGTLKPTSRSITYSFVLNYSMRDTPKIRITSPELKKNSNGEEIPHVYSGKNLCLYYPKYYEFSRTDFLCDTIIPWTSLWLYYYEIWHITNNWLGGGIHPNIIKSKANEKKR
jgi:hypothetical protein